MEILLGIAGVLEAVTKMYVAIASTQTPAQQAELWNRYLSETKWMHDLLAKFSDDISKAIAAGIAKGN